MVSKRCFCYVSVLLVFFSISLPVLMDYIIYFTDDGGGDDHEQPPLQVLDSGISSRPKGPVYLEPETLVGYPILVWWTPFTGYQRIIHNCSGGSCLFTHSRTEANNTDTAGFMFYGTMIDWTDLPIPRDPGHLWVLFHEESSKNNWHLVYPEVISLFNITATPSRHSSYPLVTQYLESIERLMLPLKHSTSEKSKGDKGLVMYLHSDCDPPSDRDTYVKELMKYVKVDSYGKCLHNKDLPENLRDPVTGMDSEELIDIISQYKFTLAMENAICEDYITEKFWRPFYASSVPIVKGSPSVSDWAPDEHSIILIDNYASPKELAEYLLYLDKNDKEYEKYLTYKQNGVTNQMLLSTMKDRDWSIKIRSFSDKNMVESFECYTCNKIHERLKSGGVAPLVSDGSHYSCQFPRSSVENQSQEKGKNGKVQGKKGEVQFWRQLAKIAEYQAKEIGRGMAERIGRDKFRSRYNDAIKDVPVSEWMYP